MQIPTLSLLETRVLGVLVEKQHTVPDSYPLTLNALVSGCNQKTSRDPVIEASEAEVQAAVDRLKSLSMVVESSGGRVMRYAQNVGKVLGVPPQSVALLAALFLRGPQTAGELRINTERLHRFGDILAVEGFLNELAERREGALVRELPRLPGARETRWSHLVSGEPHVPQAAAAAPASASEVVGTSELAAIRANVDRLEGEVASLRETVAKLCRELGITP
ncbi:MAG TPA: YceH family protein [Usitatibacter sp.]|nr:YceH family protein [Usitatibacter sp.]